MIERMTLAGAMAKASRLCINALNVAAIMANPYSQNPEISTLR
ncbi:hypothetical protein KPC_0674 [Acinetobacter stercoris]|uniref:Uncharacterized protein n=1 Tax=Acinetobacter stercoris TaxID=2126983 RepID=A0A2U3MVP9_9GAMM|nr:hypothetical protein KPC_0674 [Acinetobacter stercoris]